MLWFGLLGRFFWGKKKAGVWWGVFFFLVGGGCSIFLRHH